MPWPRKEGSKKERKNRRIEGRREGGMKGERDDVLFDTKPRKFWRTF